MKCTNCAAEVSASLEYCGSCGTFAGYPNVRLAALPEEAEALESRYFEALIEAEGRGALDRVEEFEAAVRTSSRAVVAMDIDQMRSLAVNSNALYSNYQMLVRARIRQPALLSHDQRRMAVDGKLWGTFGDQIRYASLTLDGKGLSSYGDCFGVLKELNVQHRASVLERNSFDFIEMTAAEPLPLGFRSTWHERHMVAVAKCAKLISSNTALKSFPDILTSTGTDRSEDEFIEVHIFGSFDFKAFEALGAADKTLDARDQLTLAIIKEKAAAEGKTWLS